MPPSELRPVAGPALSRRELLAVGAAAGYALAAGPARAEAIRTDAVGLETGDVEIPVPGAPMTAYRAQPARGGPFGVVLVVHEIFGVHEYVRDVCRRLAKAGYLALAPDLYRRHGDVSKLADVNAIVQQVVAKVPDAEVLADLDAAAAWGASHGGRAGKLAVVGFCWGGRIVWLYAAHRPRLTAGAAWYGRLAGDARPQTPRHPLDVAAQPLAPVLGLYGGADTGIPLESVFEMRRRLAEAGQKSEILIYPEAPHGFHADYRPSYRQEDAGNAWQRMLDWFRKERLDRPDA